jgi:hypothetical protein
MTLLEWDRGQGGLRQSPPRKLAIDYRAFLEIAHQPDRPS